MLKDMEKNNIKLIEKPNGHMLVFGQSGAGKTYFMCRRMEEDRNNGKNILVFDYSGSYTRKEFEKNKFCKLNEMSYINPSERSFKWKFRGNEIENAISGVLIRVLPVCSVYQIKLLREAITKVFVEFGKFNLTQLVTMLEKMLNTKVDATDRENITHLLTRLSPFSELTEISVVTAGGEEKNVKISPIIVIQLSNYLEIQKKFLLNFFVELLWEEIKQRRYRADILIFDEFQHLNLKEESAVSALLREGRKYDVSVYAASQFIGKKERANVETLMQAGNKIFFHPTENEMRDVARWINPQNQNQWMRILNNLSVGQAVVKGCYYINNRPRVCKKPIICSVQEVTE